MTRAWALVGLLWIAFCLNYIDRQVAFSIFPALRRELGFSPAELGWVGTVFIWSYSLALPFAGKLADRTDKRRMIAASLLLWSLAIWGSASAASVGSFLAWRAVMGLTEALYFPAAAGFIASIHTGPTRSRALGLHQSAQLFGGALGGWYGGWSADGPGWRYGFTTLALIGILYAFLLGFVLPKTTRADGEGAPAGTLWTPAFSWMIAAFFGFCGVLWMLYAWLPSHLGERFALSMTEAGWRGTVFLQGSSFAGILIGGFYGDRTGRRLELAALGMLLSPVFGYFVFAAPTMAGSVAATVGFGLGAGLIMSNLFAAAFALVGPGRHGWAAGLLNMAGGISGGLGMLLAGYSKDSAAYVGLLTFLAAAGLLIQARRLSGAAAPPRS
jgi:MFS family permease